MCDETRGHFTVSMFNPNQSLRLIIDKLILSISNSSILFVKILDNRLITQKKHRRPQTTITTHMATEDATHPTWDLEQYYVNYSGHGQIHRLLFIASKSPPLQVEALKHALRFI